MKSIMIIVLCAFVFCGCTYDGRTGSNPPLTEEEEFGPNPSPEVEPDICFGGDCPILFCLQYPHLCPNIHIDVYPICSPYPECMEE